MSNVPLPIWLNEIFTYFVVLVRVLHFATQALKNGFRESLFNARWYASLGRTGLRQFLLQDDTQLY